LENRDAVVGLINDAQTDDERNEAFLKCDLLERRVERRMRDALADAELHVFIKTRDHQIERLIEREGWRQEAFGIPRMDDIAEPVMNPGVDTDGQPVLIRIDDFHEWRTRERHGINPFRSGAPGKPSATRVLEQEHQRRLTAGETFESVGREAA
jgi:hypothetical protein